MASGNWGSDEAVPVLSDALEDPSPLVRGHAAWALGSISSPSARKVLEARSSVESDPWVQQELSSALDNWRPTGK